MTGLLLAAVLAFSSCQIGFASSADLNDDELQPAAQAEEVGAPEEEIPEAADVFEDVPEAADVFEEIPEEIDVIDEEDTVGIEEDVSEDLIEEFSDDLSEDEEASIFEEFYDGEEAAAYADAYTYSIIVRADPSSYGSVAYKDADGNWQTVTRIEDFPVAEDGTLSSVLLFVREPTDKLNFSHWELNGTKLVDGVNCTLAYDEIDVDIDIGITAVDPGLLTGNDVLTAVFIPTMYATAITGFDFIAGEGGSLRAEDWKEPYETLTCYGSFDSIDSGYRFLYNKITAVPDEGWTFTGWKDKNGNVISTDAVITGLDDTDENGAYSSPFITNLFTENWTYNGPYTAVFNRLPAVNATAVCRPAKWGNIRIGNNTYKEYEFTIEADGTVTDPFYAEPASIDKLRLNHYVLNGTRLVQDENCRYLFSEDNYYDDMILTWVDPSLLTDEENTLEVVFGTNSMYMTSMNTMAFAAGEGGMLMENLDGKLIKEGIYYTTYPEAIDAGWDTLPDLLNAIPDEGYIFAGWRDRYGHVVSMEEELTGLYGRSSYTSYFFENMEDGPFTAAFDKMGDGKILVRADPYSYGSLSYFDAEKNYITTDRIEGLPIAENGTLSSVIRYDRPTTDKLVFSHWELNGTKLEHGVNCTLEFDEVDRYIDIGIIAVDPGLLTGNDVLTAVFKPTMYATGITGFDLVAGEGGKLRANDWSEPYDVLTCYASLDTIDHGYMFMYSKVTAVPDDGWRFAAWKDRNGNVISTDAQVSDLESVFADPFGDSVFANNNIAPFTAVFEKIPTQTISGSGSSGSNDSTLRKARKALDDSITKAAADESAGSEFGKLALLASSVKKTSLTLKWNRVNGATGYILYGSASKEKFKCIGTFTGLSNTVKNLKKGKDYKYKVVAISEAGGKLTVLSTSKVAYVTTAGGKKGNAKKISLKSKSKVKLANGRSSKIKASVAASGKKKMSKHRALSYESSDPTVAKVSAKGKIKAVGKGSCTIYVYAQNGVCKKIKVNVK